MVNGGSTAAVSSACLLAENSRICEDEMEPKIASEMTRQIQNIFGQQMIEIIQLRILLDDANSKLDKIKKQDVPSADSE